MEISVVAEATIPSVSGQWMEWDVTNHVKDAIHSGLSSVNFLLKFKLENYDGSTRYVRFSSSEASSVPVLDIDGMQKSSTSDVYIDQNYPDINLSSYAHFYCRSKSTAQNLRGIISMDISGISSVTAASLNLYVDGINLSAGMVIQVYKLTRADWVEDQATWNIFKTGSSWTTSGGDYTDVGEWQDSAGDEFIPNYPPASKIKLNFKAGDSDPLLMGIFYVDRTNCAVGRANASVDARNSVGKYLKDQTFDERNIYPKQQIQLLLAQIIAGAGITSYYVGTKTTELGMEFSPNQDILSGLDDVLTIVRDWMIREEPDGKVVIAERTDTAFTQPGTYTFYRNRDVFSRSVTKDDNNTYGRVCVHTSDFSVKAYRPVSSSLGWLPPAQKTLYQQCPDGTTSIQAAALAVEIAEQMSNSGEVEEFVGPIRPQLMPRDAAQIIDEDGPNLLGTITTVTHRFGPDGFYTQFTVDSGGKINKPLLSDYLKQISAGTVKSKILT